MILLLVELIMIVAYMYKSTIVGLISWFIICIIQYKDKINSIDFWMALLICSLPISYLEVTGEIGTHIFKWYNFAILGISITIILMMMKRQVYINKYIFISVYICLAFQLIRSLFLQNLNRVFLELAQEYITIIAVMLFYFYSKTKNKMQESIMDNTEKIKYMCAKWTSMYLNVILTSAVCVIIQQMMYSYAHISIGNMTVFPNRISYDMTFTGYSVLSSYLGGGLIISVKYILDEGKITKYFFSFVIILYAMIVNSARSGLFSAFIIVYIMLIFAYRKKTFKHSIIISVPTIMASIYALYALSKIRIDNMFDDNGRLYLIKYAKSIMLSNVKTFLLGTGINSSDFLDAQHNMFLEFWFLNGTILMIAFLIAVFSILWITRKKKNRFLLWQLLLAHQFFSSFFSTTFLLVVVALTLVSDDD